MGSDDGSRDRRCCFLQALNAMFNVGAALA